MIVETVIAIFMTYFSKGLHLLRRYISPQILGCTSTSIAPNGIKVYFSCLIIQGSL